MNRAVRFAKQMTNNTVLKMISFPPPKEYFLPFVTTDGKILPPRVSYQFQWRIRRACEAAKIDAEKVVGLPPLPKESLFPKQLLQKGSQRPIEKAKRQQKVQENMEKMEQRIAQYKEVSFT
jgi:hypothetical protein